MALEQLGLPYEGQNEVPQQWDSLDDNRRRLAARMGIFRKNIIDLAISSNDSILNTIQADKLTDEDRHFFREYEVGRVTLGDVEAQLNVIPDVPQTTNSRKLLKYLQDKLEHPKFQ